MMTCTTPTAVGSTEFTRPDWDDYFLGLAKAVAARADCRRRKAAAVIVKDHRVVSTGYNGGPAGGASCLAGECPRGLLSYEELREHTDYESGLGRCVAIHAEANAIIHADFEDMVGATIYMTPGMPCPGCAKLISGTGIKRVVWDDGSYIL